MAAEKVIGNLVVRIGGDTKGLTDAVTRADGSMKSIERTAQAMSKVIAGAITGAALAMVVLTKNAQDTIDKQVKLAERLDSSVSSVQTLAYAADLAGIEFEGLSKSVDKLNAKIGEAMRDSFSAAADAVRRLGLNARDLSKMDADERLAAIADAVKRLGLNGSQAADAVRELGIRGGDFVTFLRKGGDEIRNASKDLRDFGVALSDIDGKKVEMANDAMTTLGYVTKGAANQMAVALAPAISAVSEYLADASRNTGGFKGLIENAVDTSVRAFNALRREVYETRVQIDEAIADVINMWDKLAGFLPGIISKITGISTSDLGFEKIQHSFGQLRATLEKPPSPEEWDKWWESQKKKANEAAQAAVDAAKKSRAPQGGEVLSARERKALEEKFQRLQESIASEDEALRLQRDRQIKELDEFHQRGIVSATQYAETRVQIEEKHQEKMKALIQQKLEEGILTEQELYQRKYDLQLKALQEFEDNKTITTQRANELRKAYAEQYATDMALITARQYSQLAGIVDTSLGAISGIIKNENSKAFKAMKIISTATALVKGYEATVSAYAAGAKIGGPAMGAVFAGIAAAGTAAIIAKINGVGENSTGSVSVPASAVATPATPAAQPQTLIARGLTKDQIFGGDFVRSLAGDLLEFQKNGGRVVFEDK
ncbi:MAG: hypothetical protein AB7O46_00425 [Xanthobacteraceae bacterium]